jgi:type IV pilus assembly protein PilW
MRAVSSPLQRGFTLIEIMVGCAISVVGLLVIFQTIAVWNRHSQTTMSGGDADVGGTLAIFNVERDIRLAGMGIGTATPALMGCPVAFTDSSGGGRAFTFPMSPVNITLGAGGAPDKIDVLYGNSAFFTAGERVISATPTSEFLARRNGFKAGDVAIVAGTGASGVPACALVEITGTSNPDGFTVDNAVAPNYTSYYAASGASSASRYNPATPYPVLSSSTLFSLGPQPKLDHWEIANNRVLQRTELIGGAAPFDIAEGVINMKAEYGVDANGDGKIDDATEWTSAAPADWTTALAIRMAVLVRSSQFERSPDAGASDVTAAVTPVAPSWADGAASHVFLMTNVDGTADSWTSADPVPNNWRYYRYRVFEKVIPLRNVIW